MYCAAAEVHEGLRFEEDCAVAGDFREVALPFWGGLKGRSGGGGEAVKHHEADVVTGLLILLSGISEADNEGERHGRSDLRFKIKKRPDRLRGPGVLRETGFRLLGRRARCCFGNGGGWFAKMGDDDFSRMGGADAGREGDVADVERVADLQVSDINFNGLRKVIRKAGDFDSVDVLFDKATCFDAYGLTVEVSWNVGGDGGVFVDGAEVGVQRDARKRVVLDGLKEGEAGAVAFDFQVDEDVFRAAMGKEVSKGLGIDLEVDVFGAFSVNDGWNPAFTAHLFETAGAAAVAWCCLECGLLGHDVRSFCMICRRGLLHPVRGGRM